MAERFELLGPHVLELRERDRGVRRSVGFVVSHPLWRRRRGQNRLLLNGGGRVFRIYLVAHLGDRTLIITQTILAERRTLAVRHERHLNIDPACGTVCRIEFLFLRFRNWSFFHNSLIWNFLLFFF